MMTATEWRESFIKSMIEDIIDEKPKMIIRRLQNDNAFAIYIKINDTDAFMYSSNMRGIVPIQSLKFPNFRVLIDACLKITK